MINKVLIVIWITLNFLFLTDVFAWDCKFWGFKLINKNVYIVNYCNVENTEIIPFADNDTFVVNDSNLALASDKNYNYYQNLVISKTDNSEFIRLNNFFYTDNKNIFVLSENKYLYLWKYDSNFEIFPIFESKNSWRYLLKNNNRLLNIKINNSKTSYKGSIHEIININSINNFQQINEFIYTDSKYFYASYLSTVSNISESWLDFWFWWLNAELFSSNNQEFFNIYNLGLKMNKLDFSLSDTSRIQWFYDKLSLVQNPYIYEDNNDKYWEFFIKKELLLFYLWNILK